MTEITGRVYCPECLHRLGVLNSPEHLKTLEDLNKFPRRIGPLMWDADQIDDWLELLTGMRPPTARCEC